MAPFDADSPLGATFASVSEASAKTSRRVTLPLEPLDVAPGHGSAVGSVDDLVAALGPANLRVAETIAHCRPLGIEPQEMVSGEVLTLYYGTGLRKAADIAAGQVSGIGVGPDGYYGAGVYLAGDTYTALRVAESAVEREGLYGADAVHQAPVPINLFTMRVSTGRVCDLKAEAGALRQWAWRTYGIYEADAALRRIPEFLRKHGYDTGVSRGEAGPGQDYWVVPDRYRLTLVEQTVLMPTRNLVGQRGQAPGTPLRLESVLANVALDPAAYISESLTGSQLETLLGWREARANASPREAFRLEGEQRQEVRRWVMSRLPQSAPEFGRRCLMVEGLAIATSQRVGIASERWQQLFGRLQETGEWDGEIVARTVELILLQPERHASVSQALYWAVRQYVRRSGW